MTQIARPNSDVVDGAWTAQGGPSDLYDCLDEVTPSDSDYIEDIANNTTCKLGLSNLTDPVGNVLHTLTFRHWTEGSGGPERTEVKLIEGSTERASTSVRTTANQTWEDESYTLTTGEADTITDYTNLFLEIISSNLAGGEIVRVSHATFQVPDAPPSGISIPIAMHHYKQLQGAN